MSPTERGIRAGVRRLFRLALRRRDLARADVDDEIAFHIDARVRQFVAAGMSPDEARSEALRRFGDVAGARAELASSAARQAAQLTMRDRLEAFTDDVRYVARSLARSRVFTLTVVLTFALGIGANAAMFGIIDRLLLRGPEHVVAPQRVQRLYLTEPDPARGPQTDAVAGYVSYALLRDHARTLEGVAAYAPPGEMTRGLGVDAQPIRVAHATWDFFPLVGVRPKLGRFFAADEDRPPNGERVLVLDEDYWDRAFGGDSTVIGTTIKINGEPFEIVGIAPARFTGVELQRVDAWAPMSLIHPTNNWPTSWQAQWLAIVARLKPGATARAASAEATQLHRRNYTGRSPTLGAAELAFHPISYNRWAKEPPEASVSRWLGGVSAIVLLIACANVTNLLLARAARRRREIAVRLAVGISRWRLVRLLVTESVVLALIGCVGALAIAYWGGALIRALLLPDVAWAVSPIDVRVLVVALTLAIATGVLVGVAPLFQANHLDVTNSLKTGSQQAGWHRSGVRSTLLFAQAALSVILLVGAGLFVRSLLRVRDVDLGFQPDRVLAAEIGWLPMPNLSPEQRAQERARRRAVYQSVVERLRATSGVGQAAIAVGTPFGNSFSGISLRIPGYDSIPELGGGGPYISAVTSGYFEATGTRLLHGRTFNSTDRAGSERVVIINETMARTLWPNENPIGKCLGVFFRDTVPCASVVGVVGDVRRWALREKPAMQYYVPYGHEVGIGGSVLLVRPTAGLEDFAPTVKRVIQEVEPNLLTVRLSSMQERIDPLVRPWRLGTALFGVFGLIALAIAAIGLYSVIAYMVAQRTQEFGIRLALGATTRRILSLVLSGGMAASVMGLAVGFGVALVAGRFLEPLLFETSARDPFVFGLALVVLACVAVLACLIPARRATRVDPVIALRAE
jgi:putative ABC transport system permease protein